MVFVSKLAEIAYFCKITSTSSCLVDWIMKYYLCWLLRSVWITEGSSDVWIQWCRHKVSIISISCAVELVTTFVILMICFICEYLTWSGTILCCYSKQSATRNILKKLHIFENSYPRKGIIQSGSTVYVPIVELSVLVQ